jgi:hypothetical protein
MADPTDLRNEAKYQCTQELISATQAAQDSDIAGCEMIELVNKSTSKAYFRADTADTEATAGETGNGDVLVQELPRLIYLANVSNISIICNTEEMAKVFVRKYS